MAYFPIFVELENKEIVVIGAGEIALRKILSLLPFNPKITVVAKEINEEIKRLYDLNKIDLKIKYFEESDIKNDAFLVIVAIDDVDLQMHIANICKQKNILVNSVDKPQYCSFIFGSIIRKKDLVIGISTSSKAPAVSKVLKEYLLQCLPDNIEILIEKVNELRKVNFETMQATIKDFFNNVRN